MGIKGVRTRWIAGAAVVAVAVAATLAMLLGADGPTSAAAATTRVQRGTVTLAVAAAGTVASSSTRGLSFSVSGTVTEVNVRAGDVVTAGQVLAKVDPTAVLAAVASARSRVDDAEEAVDRAQASGTTCQNRAVGANAVARTTTTATPTPSPSTSPHPSVSPAPARTTPAPAPTSCATAVRTSDSLFQAQTQLNNATLSLRQAEARAAGTTITAPVGGRVLSVGGKVGSVASPGGTGFIVLGDVATLTVKAQFTEADVGRLRVGQVSAITLPDREPVAGKVSEIDPAGTVSNRLVRYGVVIAFDPTPSDLLLGQSAQVTVTTAAATDVLFVLSAGLRGVTGTSATVVVRQGGQDESRSVTVGLRGDQYTEVAGLFEGDLAEGDEVVLPTSP